MELDASLKVAAIHLIHNRIYPKCDMLEALMIKLEVGYIFSLENEEPICSFMKAEEIHGCAKYYAWNLLPYKTSTGTKGVLSAILICENCLQKLKGEDKKL